MGCYYFKKPEFCGHNNADTQRDIRRGTLSNPDFKGNFQVASAALTIATRSVVIVIMMLIMLKWSGRRKGIPYI